MIGRLFSFFNYINQILIFWINKVDIDNGSHINGLLDIHVSDNATVCIGKNFRMNSGRKYNPIGRQQQCIFRVYNRGILRIGDNVGISDTAIVCRLCVIIGDNVKIGGGTVIYDTDFHSLNYLDRRDETNDKLNTINKRVSIGNDVFIGAHSCILKGVTIGDNSIIGACSVVTKNIPVNQIWAGNPAKFIKDITNE